MRRQRRLAQASVARSGRLVAFGGLCCDTVDLAGFLLRGQKANLDKAFMRAVIPSDDYRTENMRISQGLLSLMEDIPKRADVGRRPEAILSFQKNRLVESRPDSSMPPEKGEKARIEAEDERKKRRELEAEGKVNAVSPSLSQGPRSLLDRVTGWFKPK